MSNTPHINMIQTIIFSKDRPFQVDGLITSLYKQNKDHNILKIYLYYKASNYKFENQYRILKQKFPNIDFIYETNFYEQVLYLIRQKEWVLFLVDDVILYRPFFIQECLDVLIKNPNSISVNLLLGYNTIYCHTQNADQKIPILEQIQDSHLLRFRWQDADYDFGYPLEISGSLYRSSTILELLDGLYFDHPNRLEAILSQQTHRIRHLPWRIIFPQSVGFCFPLNRVQNIFPNRIAEHSIDSEQLAKWFDEGKRLDVDAYTQITPNAVHFEAPLFVRQESISIEIPTTPKISAVIPVYNGAVFLPQAVASLIHQNYSNLEIIIINDGSTDDTSFVAHQLASKYSNINIYILDKKNGGLADARNTGVQKASGEWILPLDCDDCFAPGFIYEAINVISKNPEINLIFSDVQEFGAQNNIWKPSEYSWNEILIHNTFPYASLYRRELWQMAGGYDPSIPWGAEDWSFWISCTPFGIKSYRLNKIFFHYRIHAQGSMYTRMMEHWPEVLACLHTLHPTMYSIDVILSDHQIVASMHQDTFKKIESIIERHPHLPMPYFWRGLVYEGMGKIPEALTDYIKAEKLAPYEQWQIHYRLYMINTKLKRKEKSILSAKECIKRRPELKQIFLIN